MIAEIEEWLPLRGAPPLGGEGWLGCRVITVAEKMVAGVRFVAPGPPLSRLRRQLPSEGSLFLLQYTSILERPTLLRAGLSSWCKK